MYRYEDLSTVPMTPVINHTKNFSFITGVVNTSSKFITSVNDNGDKHDSDIILECLKNIQFSPYEG